MATILNSEVEVYTGTSVDPSKKLGNTITSPGGVTVVELNNQRLGEWLQPGTQYSVRARCTNSDEYTSDWTALKGFKTLCSAGFLSADTTENSITVYGELEYTDVHPTHIGIYYSTSSTGENAQAVWTDAQSEQEGIDITGLTEHTTYYVIMAAKDAAGPGGATREWKNSWTDAEEITTAYAKSNISITELTADFQSISGEYSVTSTTPITAISAEIVPSGGGTTYKYDLDPSETTGSFVFANGDEDSYGHTIVISPSTEYNVTVTVTNSGGAATRTTTVTTSSQEHSTIEITSITNVTNNSATVNLTFGS